MSDPKIKSTDLNDLINKSWRIAAFNCKGRPELIQEICITLVERSLTNVPADDLRQAILEYNHDNFRSADRQKT